MTNPELRWNSFDGLEQLDAMLRSMRIEDVPGFKDLSVEQKTQFLKLVSANKNIGGFPHRPDVKTAFLFPTMYLERIQNAMASFLGQPPPFKEPMPMPKLVGGGQEFLDNISVVYHALEGVISSECVLYTQL